MCNRASGARCAGVPNLGWIGGELVDFLPQLCGGMCGRALILARSTKTQSLQRNLTDLPSLIDHDRPPSRLYIGWELWYTQSFSRTNSDLKPLPTERLPTRLADECERAAAKAPRRSVEDRGHEFLCTARGRWPPRREVGGGRSGVCGQRRPARSHDRGPRRDGGEKGSARFFWALQGCSTELETLCHTP